MDVDRAKLDFRIVRPDRFQQLLARKHPAGMLEEMPQQPEFGRARARPAAVAADAVRGDVHLEAGIAELLGGERGPRPGAAPRRPRDQLLGLNGLVT